MLPSIAWSTNVDGVRLWRAPDSTRLVFDLNGASEHKIFTLRNPDRVVIDIEKTQFKATTNELLFTNTPILKMRYGARDKTDLRVVLDLKASVNPRSFFLAAHGGKPDRLVIDLFDKAQTTQPIAPKTITQEQTKRDILIAIDAGHGGEDPGAIGPNKVREKDVVLKIATQLKWIIEKQKGYTVKMVRTGDYYVGLSDRRNLARSVRADLFISIHADAFTSSQANGASVYALSRRGATSETARFLASRENDADLIGGVGDIKLDDKDQVLAGILVDLSMNSTLANSLSIGDRVLKSIGKITKLHSKRVEQAGFMVLKSPDVPSLLIETGYISNPREAKLLNTSRYRKKMAKAIFDGLHSYFSENPPEGSLLSYQKYGAPIVKSASISKSPSTRNTIKNSSNAVVGLNKTPKKSTVVAQKRYTISRGDTLSGIASKNKTTVKALMKMNSMRSSSIRVGQKILVPALQ